MRAADAQAVAAKLLDFYREPARHRPRYIGGQETIDGSWVIKFAQSRFPHAVLRGYNLGERATLREAAHAFIRQVCLRDAASHFDLLCVRPDATPEAIKENYHLLMALIHPDRQGAVAAAWPTDCAQRVNQAYAVLSEERARRGYEANLRESATRAARSAPPSRQPAGPAPRALGKRRRRGLVRAAVVVSAVMAALLLVQLLWVSYLPEELGLLERSYAGSGRWMRGVFPTGEQPRYLSDSAPPTRPVETEDAAPPVRPARSRDPSVIVMPDIAPPPARPMKATIAEPIAPAKSAAEQGVAPKPAAPAVKPSHPSRIAENIQPASTQPSAQAISSADVETLIARLVSYYEAGDVDNLMALLDRNEAASLRGAQMRQAYRDFFGATRQRRLRLSTVAWQLGGASAQARGEAALSAEYFEQPAVERHVSVELDIALRDGRPRITRLALFPSGM